jgi:hypothetical protein
MKLLTDDVIAGLLEKSPGRLIEVPEATAASRAA